MRLKEARKKARLSQQQVADHIGISQNTYSYWENGKYNVDSESLKKLSELFNVSIDYLLGVSEEKTEQHTVTLTPKDEKDIEKTLEQMVADLNSGQDGPTFYGGNMELSEYDREVLTRSLDETLRLIKLRNKEKYTPKKYKEDLSNGSM